MANKALVHSIITSTASLRTLFENCNCKIARNDMNRVQKRLNWTIARIHFHKIAISVSLEYYELHYGAKRNASRRIHIFFSIGEPIKMIWFQCQCDRALPLWTTITSLSWHNYDITVFSRTSYLRVRTFRSNSHIRSSRCWNEKSDLEGTIIRYSARFLPFWAALEFFLAIIHLTK